MLADRGGSPGPHAPGRVSATFHNDGDAVAAALAVRTALPSTTVSLHTGGPPLRAALRDREPRAGWVGEYGGQVRQSLTDVVRE